MKMAKYILFSMWTICSLHGIAQDSCSLMQKVRCADTDKLDHLYLATEQNAVVKYDSRCKELYRYTNNYLGYPSRIDATNPINVICYYPALQTIVTLDVTMNEISRTDLISLGFLDVRAVCSSNDGHLWILDAMDFKLKKINRLGRLLAESENLLLVLGALPEVSYMQELNNQVFLLEKEKAVYRFDNFGNYKQKQLIPGIVGMHTFSNSLFYWTDTVVESFHLQSRATTRIMALSPEQLPVLIHHRTGRRWLVYVDQQWIVSHPN
jgi:hypothetical protein